jgi:hypothetical protein
MPKKTARSVIHSAPSSPRIACPHCQHTVIPLRNNLCPFCLLPIPLKRESARAPVKRAPSSEPVRLFRPRQVFILSAVSGWPTGLVLSSINWIRMGNPSTAVVHWVVGAIVSIPMILWSLTAGGGAPIALVDLVIHFGVCLYLQNLTAQSIRNYTSEGRPASSESWAGGCLIAVLTPLMVFLAVLFLAVLIVLGSARTPFRG